MFARRLSAVAPLKRVAAFLGAFIVHAFNSASRCLGGLGSDALAAQSVPGPRDSAATKEKWAKTRLARFGSPAVVAVFHSSLLYVLASAAAADQPAAARRQLEVRRRDGLVCGGQQQ